MEGLEISILNLSHCKSIIDFRIDSDTYKKAYLESDLLIKNHYHKSIEDLSHSVRNFGAYSLCNFINFIDEGIPFLMTENIRHNFIDWNIRKYIDNRSHKMLYKSHCHERDLLITMAGEYLGRVAVYDKKEICSSNQAIAKVEVQEGNNPYTISTFLNSKHGQNQINRFRTATGQPNINMSLIKSLLIPLFSSKMDNIIEKIIQNSEYNRTHAQSLYHQAEELLLKEIGLEDFEPSEEGINIKSFKDSFVASGRLDAEYYQPKYDKIENCFDKFERIKLSDLVNYPISSGITPKAGGDAYVDEKTGIPFVRAVDLQNGEVNTSNFNYIKKDVHNGILKRTKLRENDVLFSIAGTVGRAAIFKHKFAANINQAIAILRFEEIKVLRNYLVVFFNSSLGKEFISKYSRQGLQTNLNLQEVGDLYIPIIDPEVQTQIASLVEESFSLKSKSEKLLAVAKKAVEIAIEQSEEAAFSFIEQETQFLTV